MKFHLLIGIVFFPILLLAQSPWTPGKGKHYHQISFTTVPAYDKLFTNSGDAYQLERFVTDNTLQYYGEVGLMDNLSLTAIIPLKFLKSGKASEDAGTIPTFSEGTFTTLGNVSLAAKYNLYNVNKFSFAVSMRLGLPASAHQLGTGLRGGFDAWSWTPSLSVGYNQEKFYAYSSLAYNGNSNGYASNVIFELEGGVKIDGGFIIAAQFSSIQNVTDGTYIPSAFNLNSGLFLNGYEYSAVVVKVIKDIIKDKLGVVASLGGGTGNLVAQSPALTISIYTRL